MMIAEDFIRDETILVCFKDSLLELSNRRGVLSLYLALALAVKDDYEADIPICVVDVFRQVVYKQTMRQMETYLTADYCRALSGNVRLLKLLTGATE